MAENTALVGKIVAVPETRQLALLASLLRNRGATVKEIPLVAIHDAPDPAPVLAWIRRFIADPPDLFILLTGEGLRRLLDLAERHDHQAAFVDALRQVRRLCRGPKPERVLRELGLAADLQAQSPTTAGVIATLQMEQLHGVRVAVQLYGEDPNSRLTGFLDLEGAIFDTVAPYVYAAKEDEQIVLEFIESMARGEIDAVAFTSQPQYQRLADVAQLHGKLAILQQGLERTMLAAVGPVVAARLQSAGLSVAVIPERTWFMKPLVTALQHHFEQAPKHPL